MKANCGRVKIKDLDGEWDVAEKWASMPASVVIDNSSDYRRHRGATDISTWQHLGPIV